MNKHKSVNTEDSLQPMSRFVLRSRNSESSPNELPNSRKPA